MKIELYIDGEKKLFTAPFVPMLAKRKFLEIQAKAEKLAEEERQMTSDELLEEDDQILSILADVVFQKQFTVEQLYAGASKEYIDQKLFEAIYGVKEKDKGDEGNAKGE